MAINRWWRDEPDECYWMEITNRGDLGADLHAPQVDDAGTSYWSYNLVTEVRDGDLVLHWHKDLLGVPAMVGYSVADGAPEEGMIVWSSRGTYGRHRSSHAAEPSWLFPVRDFKRLAAPVTQDDLRRNEHSLRRVHTEIQTRHAGPLYFPFAFSDKRPVRTAQGYLVKFPAALLEVLPGLSLVPRIRRDLRTAERSAPALRRGTGRIADSALRKALEHHAVALAVEYYERSGFDQIENVGASRSYDLLLMAGTQVRHVEVKGSSSNDIDAVELTDGEVRHSDGNVATDLFVVDSIRWFREADGTISTVGGRSRVWRDWMPAKSALTPTRYRYALPTRQPDEST